VKTGWGRPVQAKFWHYFVGSRALCGKWLFFGPLELGKDDSPDNCGTCKKKLAKIKDKEGVRT